MNARLTPPTASRNPIVQVLSLLIGSVVLIGAVVLGAFLLAIAIGVALVLALVLMARVWWLRRRLAKTGRDGGAGQAAASGGRVIEAEYTVVDRDRKD